jgi:hypothetical protein
MTAIEIYYSSVNITKPYFAGDDQEDEFELTKLEEEAEWEFYLLNQAGIRKDASDEDYRDF